MYAKWCTMSNLAVPISRLYDFMDWILCSDDCWLVQTWQMLCGLKTILTDMNILNSYRHIRPKKVKYPIPEIPDDSGKKSGTDWVLPKIIGSGRVSGTRQALAIWQLLSRTHYMSPVRAWKWKWSNGVEKSESDLFWCISMTNNVKSCKKINGRVQTFRFSVFTMGRQELCAENT